MRASHALIQLRKFILVYWLPFLLWQLYHYFAWVILEPNYEKFLIPGTDSLCFFNDFQSENQRYFRVINSELFLILKPLDPFKRLKWFGIDQFGESDAKKFDDMFGDDCKCEFKCEFKCTCCKFKCTCGWNENITLQEHKSFQDLRIVSKLGI